MSTGLGWAVAVVCLLFGLTAWRWQHVAIGAYGCCVPRRRALAVAVAIAGCGGPGAVSEPLTLPRAPATVGRACLEAAHEARMPVACPTRWPAGDGRSDADFSKPPQVYLLDFANGFARHGAHVFHVILGGQRRTFGPVEQNLRLGTRTRTVPMRGGGRFVVERPARLLRTASVHGAPARVLRAAAFPQGGLHGGHVLVLWNEHGHGYMVSIHAARMPVAHQVAVVLEMARSTEAVR